MQTNADLIRGGCRGGHDQFQWESLRTMKYHDREQYLGQTTIVGYLDKGGKWRKKDWYTRVDKKENDKSSILLTKYIELDEEIKKIKEEDEKRMRIALGIEQPDDQKNSKPQITKEELAQMTKKTKPDIDQTLDNKGLGYETTKLTINQNSQAANILEQYGSQKEYKIEEQSIDKKIKKEKKVKKEKKDKKEKKQKKKDKKEKKDKKPKKISSS
ncbi:hypothetical protein pb186bvf_014508 [Paramecium bursaria]